MSDLSTSEFDYASVDKETASKLQYFAKTGRALVRKSQIQFLADMGKLLSEARSVLSNNKNGTFIKWATAEFDVSHQTVWNYVNVWEKILSNGLTIYQNWSPTALYLLASGEISKPVQKKIAKIPSTEFVRLSYVKKLIEDSTPKPEPEPVADVVDDTDYAEDESVTSDDNEQSENDEDIQLDDVSVDHEQAADDEESSEQIVESSQASIMLDSLGKQIPTQLRPASELAIQLQSTGRELDKYRKVAKDLAAQPGGEWLNLQTIDDEVRSLKNSFQGAQYFTVCPRCEGKGCQSCNAFGYLPEHRKNSL